MANVIIKQVIAAMKTPKDKDTLRIRSKPDSVLVWVDCFLWKRTLVVIVLGLVSMLVWDEMKRAVAIFG